jgi:hypothetical protein
MSREAELLLRQCQAQAQSRSARPLGAAPRQQPHAADTAAEAKTGGGAAVAGLDVLAALIRGGAKSSEGERSCLCVDAAPCVSAALTLR